MYEYVLTLMEKYVSYVSMRKILLLCIEKTNVLYFINTYVFNCKKMGEDHFTDN